MDHYIRFLWNYDVAVSGFRYDSRSVLRLAKICDVSARGSGYYGAVIGVDTVKA